MSVSPMASSNARAESGAPGRARGKLISKRAHVEARVYGEIPDTSNRGRAQAAARRGPGAPGTDRVFEWSWNSLLARFRDWG